jgi:hypothetical protein
VSRHPSRPVPVPHLFMAISVALVAVLAVFVLVAPSAAEMVDGCTSTVSSEGRAKVGCGDGVGGGVRGLVSLR